MELRLLEALLALPDAAKRVAAEGGGAEAFKPGAGQRLAGVIFALALEGGVVEAARVMGQLEDPEVRDLCSQLIGNIHPDKDYEQELRGFARLLEGGLQRRLDEVLREIRGATDKETQKRLLAEHRDLRAQLQQGRTVARAR